MGGRDGFEEFVRAHEARLRTALVLTYGPEAGRDAAAEALAWAWEHWERVTVLDKPVPYLYRVGQSRTRRMRRRTPMSPFPTVVHDEAPWVEPALGKALNVLTTQQRTCTVLVHCFGWTLTEVAEVLDLSKSSVQTHVDRGLDRLRNDLMVVRDG
jgi:DNA-directed RNA polymerase specialized sigma24 family protein